MTESTWSRYGRRVRVPTRARAALEVLEDRCLLSVNLVEAEPNNTPASANVIERLPATQVIMSGEVNSVGDRDWFRLDLREGDVVGAALKGQSGLNPALRLVNSAGMLLIANDDARGYGRT